MKITPFETEHFFARYEFSTPYQLCNSDCESVTIEELLRMAGDSVEGLGHERLVYTQSQGSPELRQAIAETYANVPADRVVVLGTPVEGIYLAARALLDPGDDVIVVTPAYDALVNLFEHVVGTAHVSKWKFRADGSRWSLDLDDLRALITESTRLIVVNFPHNPTGYLPSPEWQRELAGLAAEHGLWLFCDEMYFGLVHSGTPAIPSMADVSDRAVVLSGLSKTYGLPGLRCGWLIVPERNLREDLVNWKFYTSICPPVPTEYLARAALRVGERLKQRNIDRIERNLAIAEAFFARWPELFEWRRPLAGSTALVGFDVPSVGALAERLATEEGILIQSAAMLGSDDRHMRIGLGRDGFAEALQRFEDWLRRNPAAC
ncbi:MAG: aminotransferase class I/II-fold pyridoxal phosphate-dependent enzyme [Xanthomonadales bacterium]|jgi:aspartate/methionine/tyrosine aminotransferase|nr:aminotransferase class I/II-fold pyridoxal phosphate-dependent enzyme [Xanthomonadales bacterium]